MANTIIYTKKLAGYKSIIWHGQAMFRHFSKLKNHLKQNLGPEYAALFAEPHLSEDDLKGFTEASWSSEWIKGKAIPLTALPEVEQHVLKKVLQDKLGTIREHSQRLLESESPEDNRWGQLINKALEIPDASHILVEDNTVVLVAWGFEYVEEAEKKYSFKKEFTKTVKPERQALKPRLVEPEPPVSPAPEDATDSLEADQRPDAIPEEEHPEPMETHSEDAGEMETQQVVTPHVAEQREESLADAPAIHTGKTAERHDDALVVKTTDQTALSTDISASHKPPPPTKNWGNSASWWRKYWWLWLFLLLLLLLILWLRNCHSTSTALPAAPGQLIPIDSTKIVSDPDSVRSIVSDRLNIALNDDNLDLNAFARRFKEAYPGNQYKIIYYDTLTYRLQIEFPAEEREKIKNELPGKIPEFKMLIWYEGIFQHNNRPGDPGFSDPTKYWYLEEVKAFEAWDITRGDSGLVIAILDDGFDLTHPEFRDKIYKPWSVPNHSPNVNTGSKFFHGTHVAGTALGLADNGQGVAGVAPNCRFMPVQIADRNGLMGSTSVIDAVLYAIHHGANVVNMSLGMAVPGNIAAQPPNVQQDLIGRLFKDEEKFWDELFKMAYDKNIVVILAAGNQNVMIGLDPMQRSQYTIKVSAVDQREGKAVFSNYGAQSSISAPGVQIFNSVPGNKYTFLSGTSMAAPIVTGGVALIKSVNPAMSFGQIVDLLQATGIPVRSGSEHIGNIMQLDRALGIARQNRQQQPVLNCPDMQSKIDSLLQEIEKIRRSCPAVDSVSKDTMRLPPNNQGFGFAEGRWQSTTYIHNSKGEKVTLQFDLNTNGTGQLTLVETDHTRCGANLALSLRSGQFNIDQTTPAVCLPQSGTYETYRFECRPDASGHAECTAQNKRLRGNNFTFRLVKIK